MGRLHVLHQLLLRQGHDGVDGGVDGGADGGVDGGVGGGVVAGVEVVEGVVEVAAITVFVGFFFRDLKPEGENMYLGRFSVRGKLDSTRVGRFTKRSRYSQADSREYCT